jgi:glycosyltransferase involved in cell wall biosynthesis
MFIFALNRACGKLLGCWVSEDELDQTESMANQPLVTAVVTTYDRPQLVRRAIKSALAQTYEPLEIIVVEDGSNGSVKVWLEEQGFDHIRYIRHEENQGLAAARNTGLKLARGKYIAYLDDDDEWLPEKTAKQVKLAEKEAKSCAVVYCGALVVSPEGDLVGENMPRLKGDIREAIHEKGLFTIPSSCLFQREALECIGGYDENLSSHIDHDIWLQLAQAGYAAEYVSECLVRAHQHLGYQMTTDVEARMQATREFCDKWRLELTDWWRQREAERYCSEFRARVMGMLGWSLVESGQRMQSAKCFLSAIRHHPTQRRYYQGLVASALGRSNYDGLVQSLKQIR